MTRARAWLRLIRRWVPPHRALALALALVALLVLVQLVV